MAKEISSWKANFAMDIQHKTNEKIQQELIDLRQEYNSLKELSDKEKSLRKFACDETLETNLKLTLALQCGNMAWWEMDVPTGNVTFDKNKVEMLGYLPENFTHYRHFTTLVHPDDVKRIMSAMQGHLEGILDKYEAEYRILASSGEYIWFYDYGAVVKKDAEGTPLICAGFVFNISERKNTEKRLMTVMKALDSTSDAIGISDSQGHHFYQNKALSDLFGYGTAEETEAAGGGMARVKDPAVAKQMFKTILNGKSWSGELEMVTKRGRVFPAYERADSIIDKQGNIIGVIGIISDITERRQSEEKFRKNENMLQTVLNNFPGIIFWKDRQSIFLGCNQSCATIAGLNSPVEIVGKTDLEMPWASTEGIEYRKADFEVMESGKERLHIVEMLHQSDGQVMWLDTSKVPMLDSRGQVIGIVGVSNDISTLMMAEQKLINTNKELVFQNEEKEKRAAELIIANKELLYQNEEKEKRAAELLNAIDKIKASDRNLKESQKIAGLGTFEVDILTGICITSEILNEIFGIDENHDPSLNGRAALLHPEDRDMVLNRLMNDVKSKIQPADIEFRIVRHNDKITRWIHGLGKLEYDCEGHPIILHGTAQDITERKQSEAEILELNRDLELRVQQRTSELEATNKELETFSYSISHDLKAPLRHISSFIGLFRENVQKELTKEQLGYLDVISSSASDMGKLIEGILDFSRLNAIELQKKTVCSSDLVQQVIKSFEPDIQNRIITFKVASLPDIKGDEGLLRQVWINLISNAIKYSMKKPEAVIEIGSFSGDNEDTFFVKDNGAGFNMKYAEKLFGVFKRLHKTSDFEGVGIGLANVNRIITRHGGRCRAEGEVNNGATFYFTLPYKTIPEEKIGS